MDRVLFVQTWRAVIAAIVLQVLTEMHDRSTDVQILMNVHDRRVAETHNVLIPTEVLGAYVPREELAIQWTHAQVFISYTIVCMVYISQVHVFIFRS